MKYYIGIDAGTTNVKSVIFNQKGEEIYIVSEENEIYSDGKISQQNMLQLFKVVKETLKELFKYCKTKDIKVESIGVTGQGEGLWAIDDNGLPVFDAVLWNDGQAAELVDQIKSNKSDYERIKQIVGSYIRSGSTLSLIKWFKLNHPDKYEKIKFFFTCKDWIRYKLTNNIYWELSDASCSCIDLKNLDYAKNVFDIMDISEAIDKLPKLINGVENSGNLTSELKQYFGIDYDIPISGGMIDIVSSAAGVGAIEEGDVCIILGTTGMTFTVKNKYVDDIEYNGWEAHIDGEKLIKGMGTMAATPNQDWLLKMIFSDEDINYEEIYKKISDYMPFESGIIYHPHISNGGERAPFWNPYATANFLGIKDNTTRYDLIHSVLEGISLSIKDCLDKSDTIKSVYLTGGGAKNLMWAQMISDVLGCEVKISNSQELGAKGAALSAMIMNGDLDLDDAKNTFYTYKKTFTPDKNKTKKYEKIFSLYKETQKNMFEFWDQRVKLMEE